MKISLCTTCMNREEYLKQTIGINLKSIQAFNANNENQFELSLCNYDSKQGLDDYIKKNFQSEIDSGVLVYTVVTNKEHFDCSHAKNIAHRYSTGEVVINLDADNNVTDAVLNFISSVFTNNNIDDIYLHDEYYVGFIGMSRNNFNKLGGYCEKIYGYGYADRDLMARAEKYLSCKEIRLMHCDFKYIDTCVIHQDNLIKWDNYPKERDGVNCTNIWDSMVYNRMVMKDYLKENIMNPNEFEKIEFGTI